MLPFRERYQHRVESIYISCKSIVRTFFFWFECTKKPVPNDKDSRVVFIQVFQIAAMMNAMMRWRIKDQLDPGRHFLYRFRMDPKLVNQTDLLHEEYQQRMEANQWHPGPK